MNKRTIEIYMDAYMEGFYSCYDMMIDMIDDDDISQENADSSQGLDKEEPEVETSANSSKPKPIPPQISEKPPVAPKPNKSKDEPKQAKNEVKTAKKEPPTHEDYVAMFKQGKLPTEVAKELNVSPQTAYNHLYKAKQAGELK